MKSIWTKKKNGCTVCHSYFCSLHFFVFCCLSFWLTDFWKIFFFLLVFKIVGKWCNADRISLWVYFISLYIYSLIPYTDMPCICNLYIKFFPLFSFRVMRVCVYVYVLYDHISFYLYVFFVHLMRPYHFCSFISRTMCGYIALITSIINFNDFI